MMFTSKWSEMLSRANVDYSRSPSTKHLW